MARWLVTQRDNQFGVDSVADLQRMANEGTLVAGDLVQPPGATEWLYAVEVAELKNLFQEESVGMSSETRRTITVVAGAVLVGLLGLGTVAAFSAYGTLNTGSQQTILGEKGLSFSEMLVTAEGASLLGEPVAASASVAVLAKDSTVDLLAKRGTFYRARTKDGQEGWIAVDQVIPMYQLGGKQAREEYDPLYNPDQYVQVGNATWGLAENSDKKTVFRFMITNDARYAMTDLKLRAVVKDGQGNEIDQVEFPVNGVVPAATEGGQGSTMVGTLMPEDKKNGSPELMTEATFQERAKAEPDLQLRWVDGVEVVMNTKDFTMATVNLVEVRAVPPQPE
jgi:hypothetical protein